MPIIQSGIYKNYEKEGYKGTMLKMTGKNQERVHIGVCI